MSTVVIPGWQDHEKRKAMQALAASILFHLLLILLIAAIFALSPVVPPLVVEETAVELTLIDPPVPKPKDKAVYIETTDAQLSEKAPGNPVFESDKNTLAAASLPASGDAPLPSQEGLQSPVLAFENQEYTPGREARPSAPAAQPAQSAAPAPPAPKAEPVSTPRQTTQLALLEPPKPVSTPKPQTQPAVQTPQTQAQNSSSPPGYQPETRITRIEGNISTRGRSSVDAVGTPLGRYKKILSDAIGSRWYFYIKSNLDNSPGTVSIRFFVSSDGKVSKVKVVSNSSNESVAECSLRAVVDAELPPIPKEIAPMLEKGRIETEFSFTVISN